MEEIEDFDMEFEQINSEDPVGEINPKIQQQEVEDRPMTPTNDISGICVQEDEHRPETPPNNLSRLDDFFRTPKNLDSSFIKRASIDKLLKSKSRAMPRRMTSTPLAERDRPRLCNTLPSSLAAPSLAHLRSVRQCKSAESFREPRMGTSGIPYEYINPFTPDGKLLASKVKAHKKFQRLSLGISSPPKFTLNDSSDSETSAPKAGSSNEVELDELPRRARLKEFNVPRYQEEFVQLQEIGKGDHGCVFKCLNRLNGCIYAVKKTLKPIKTGLQERSVRNEIYAHGVLRHTNIVQNFSCWKEDSFVYIQNEYCNGGNLEHYMTRHTMSESLLRNLLLQIAAGLKYMHKMGLAHMDVKPGNIFLSIESQRDNSMDSDGGFSDDEKDEITFKLGDLGHVSRLDEDDAEEGDCRYISREIIEETYTHLDRADIFALGLTVYEAAGGGPLPKNGDDWHDIRNGNLKYLDAYTKEFNDILKRLIDPVPLQRPSAKDLVEMLKPAPPSPLPEEVASSYIQQYRRNSTRLETTALATNQYLKVLFKSHRQMQEQLKEKASTPTKDKVPGKKKGGVTKTRVIGRKTKRSSSTTLF